MTIISRAAVREAYDRALNLHNAPDAALQAVAPQVEANAECVLEGVV